MLGKEIEDFYEYVHLIRGQSINTAKSYKRDLNKLNTFISQKETSTPKEITKEDISEWIGNYLTLD